jgi:SAM-dependent methyltransferase
MANEEQVALWDDRVGDAWVANASTYDTMLEPIGLATMQRLDLTPGDHVLDLGCGTGATTVELARRVTPNGAAGQVTGVDLSNRMVAAARARAEAAGIGGIDFVVDDVQTAELGRGRYDRAFSRMGVMFFADPAAAFTNVARSLRAGGQLAFCCFQPPDKNPAVLLAMVAAGEILSIDPPDPSKPNPFSLADAARTTALLESADFVDVDITPGPDRIELPVRDDLRTIAEKMLEQTPLTNARFAAADDLTRNAAIDATSEALEAHRTGDLLSLGAGIWLVTAHTPD